MIKKHSVLFAFLLLNIVSSILNYSTYPLLGRLLPASDFIDATVSLTFLTQIVTILFSTTALTTGVTKRMGHSTEGAIDLIQVTVNRVFIAVMIMLAVLAPLFFHGLKIPVGYIIPVLLLLVFSTPASVFTGHFSAKKRLLKVGLISLVTSCLQFSFTIISAILFKDGLLALTSMALGQLVAVLALSFLLRAEELPRAFVFTSKYTNRKLATYTIYASFAILLINLLQIADLLFVKYSNYNAALYTDIYVISRAVFFVGVLFIWPFISSIDIKNRAKNIKPLISLLLFGASVSIIATVLMLFFGNTILHLVMGKTYTLSEIRPLAAISISLKFFWLSITTISLYLMTIRHRDAYRLPMFLAATHVILLATFGRMESQKVLLGLFFLGLFGFLVSIVSFAQSLNEDVI